MRALSLSALALVCSLASTGLGQSIVSIDSGMSKADVIEKLGQPLWARTYGSSTFLAYPNGCEKSCGTQDMVILQDDHVVDAIFRSPAHRYSGKSSSPRMISAADARSVARSKGDTSSAVPAPSTPSVAASKAAPPPAPQKALAITAPAKSVAAPSKAAATPVVQAGAARPARSAPVRPPAAAQVSVTGAVTPATAGLAMFPLAFASLWAILFLAGSWRAFEKAHKPGWAALVPVYNLVVMLDIAEKPIWWLLLFLVPIVNALVMIVVFIEIAKRFNKGALFGIGLTFLGAIFFPILGFGEAEYAG